MLAIIGRNHPARRGLAESALLAASIEYGDPGDSGRQSRGLGRASQSPCQISAAIALENFQGLDVYDLQKLNALTHVIEYPKGKLLVGEDTADERVHFITSGVVRLQKYLPDGRRVVVGFALPGDVIGFSMNDTLAYSAEAVRTVHTCSLSRNAFSSLLEARPSLQRFLLSQFSHQMTMAQTQMMLLGRCSAKEKLAIFLLELRNRQKPAGDHGLQIALPMSRQDIGDFLGLTIETVSRTFTILARAKVIAIVPMGVRVTDLPALKRIADV